MTTKINVAKATNTFNDQQMYESDIDKDDSMHASDSCNGTTDDEFYNTLMDAPSEFEDRLIPDQCKDELKGIEHLTKCLDRRFHAYPVVFMGTLKDTLKEAFSSKTIGERRPLLIYVNNDKSVYTNLFCKQLLCNDKIIEYLMNNYVLWAWDVTFESNRQKLNDVCKTVFAPWNNEKQLGTNSIDQYPLLIGIHRDTNGDYLFNRFIEGPNKKLNVNEFLACLSEYKDKFDLSEHQLEKAKEEAKQQMLLNLFQSHDIHHRSKHHNHRDFLRSASMFPHMGSDKISNARSAQFSRLLSEDIGMRRGQNDLFLPNEMSKDDIIRTFEQVHIDSDDADDEDDEEQTPTVDRPSPKFA